jgi:hypothetical protein
MADEPIAAPLQSARQTAFVELVAEHTAQFQGIRQAFMEE